MSEKRRFLQRQIWYIKRGEDVEGPYPGGLISRYILVGRIKPDDQLSVDGRSWEPVSSFPELKPQVLEMDPDDPEARQRLMAAIRWEDERSGQERREGEPPSEELAAQRRGAERRNGDPIDDKTAREARLQRSEQQAQERRAFEEQSQRRYRWQSVTLVVLAIVGSIAGLMYIRPPDFGEPIDCSGPPRAGVNWSLCQMEGRPLQGADLTGAQLRSVNFIGADLAGASLQNASATYAVMSSADLRNVNFRKADLMGVSFRNARIAKASFDNANLAYADFAGADLTGASFEGAILDKAIWFDRRICAEGSIGVCR